MANILNHNQERGGPSSSIVVLDRDNALPNASHLARVQQTYKNIQQQRQLILQQQQQVMQDQHQIMQQQLLQQQQQQQTIGRSERETPFATSTVELAIQKMVQQVTMQQRMLQQQQQMINCGSERERIAPRTLMVELGSRTYETIQQHQRIMQRQQLMQQQMLQQHQHLIYHDHDSERERPPRTLMVQLASQEMIQQQQQMMQHQQMGQQQMLQEQQQWINGHLEQERAPRTPTVEPPSHTMNHQLQRPAITNWRQLSYLLEELRRLRAQQEQQRTYRNSEQERPPRTTMVELASHVINDVKDAAGNTLLCTICLEDMKLGELARTLPTCHHTFHKDCVDAWFTRKHSCPICRENI